MGAELATDCDWLSARFRGLYEHDDRGRITVRREPGHPVAPRFHLSRCRHGILWRMRTDLSPPLVRRLARLAGREVAPAERSLPWPPPERQEALRRALAEVAPIVRVHAGPVFRLSSAAESADALAVRARGSERLDLGDPVQQGELRQAFPGLDQTIAARGPLLVSRQAGRIAAVCYTAVGGALSGAEAGVDTKLAERRRGHAARVVAGWAMAVRDLGGTPFYSTSWDNRASLAVARALGLEAFADTLHWT